MTTLKRAELERDLKAGKILPLYLLTGSETYLRDTAAKTITDVALTGTLIREFNEVTFSLLSDSAMAAVAAAEQLPMMSERRVVRIKDFGRIRETDEEILIRFVQRPMVSTVMIFVTADLDKRKKLTKVLLSECAVVEFAPLRDDEAKTWARTRLQQMGTGASERVLSEIIRTVGTDLLTLSTELEKIVAGAAGTREITLEMVQQLIGRSRELSNFDLGDQIIAGNRKEALQTLHRLLEDEVAPVMLVGLLAGNYHRLAMAREFLNRGKREDAYRMFYGAPAKRDAAMRTLQKSDAGKIAQWIKMIADTDLAIKTSQGGGGPKGARLQLEILVCQLAG